MTYNFMTSPDGPMRASKAGPSRSVGAPRTIAHPSRSRERSLTSRYLHVDIPRHLAVTLQDRAGGTSTPDDRAVTCHP